MLEMMLVDSKDSILFHIIFEYFISKLNKNMLFDIKEEAEKMIRLYNELKQYGVNVETINKPRPIEIYRYNQGIKHQKNMLLN